MKIALTNPQSRFVTSNKKYVACVAGFGSGKTHVAMVRMLKNMASQPGLHQAYLAPTYPLIRDIWYPKFEEFAHALGLKYKINKSEHVIHIQGLGQIFCRTMEKPESIIGWEVGDAFLDEFDVLQLDKALHVFRKISARLRQKNTTGRKNQLFVSTTPEGFKATYALFKKDPLPDSELIQMSTYSNAHNLPADYISDLRAQYPSQLIEAYLMGEFINLQAGSVYYAYNRTTCESKEIPTLKDTLHIGMDFNVYDMCATVHVERKPQDRTNEEVVTFANMTSLLGLPENTQIGTKVTTTYEIEVEPPTKELHAVDELFGLRDTPDMIDTIIEKYPNNRVIIYPDASGRGTSAKSASISDIKLLKEKFLVKAKTRNPRVKNRVAAMNKQFEANAYFVNSTTCPNYAECLEQQPYDAKTGLPEKDGKADNRVDGAGYLMNYIHPVVKPKLIETTLGGV